ncbi:MAG: tetratricopeptide repeat protein [bacterium]|nr:tetratricopeptide repeat protein [bacterium]
MNIELYRKLLLLVTSIFVLQLVYGQSSNRLDSLIQVLHDTPDHKDKARLLLKISKGEELSDPEKSLQFSRQALQESRLAKFDSAVVRSLIQIGVNLCRLQNIKEAIETGEQVVEMASELNMLMEVADGRSIMAVAYAEVGDFDNSSKLYFENLRLYEKLNNKRLIGRTLSNIGADFISMQSYEKAMEYVNKALSISQEINNLSAITDQYNNLAAIYQIGYNDLPNALFYYSEALKIALKMNDFQQQGINMLNIGRLYQQLDNPDSASYFLNHALELFEKVNNPVLMADGYIALGNFHYKKRDYPSGRKLASKGLSIGEKYQLPQTIFNASDLLYNICLSERDTIGAFKYQVAKTQSKDSLYFLQNQNALFKLEFQYNQEKLIKDQKMRQMRNIFIFGFIILGLISGLIIIFLFYSRQKIKIKNMILGREKMEADLKFKSKELSTNLMSLLKKNELIAEINKKLTHLERTSSGNELKDSLIKLNREIKKSSENKLWQEFSVQFKETNSQFYDKLLKLYPDLTSRELQLCAYLRLNMTTKEIAQLTGQRTDTLGQARYRLRKKFGLNNMESGLVTFLMQI